MSASFGVIPASENAPSCEFESVTLQTASHLEDEALRYNILQSLERVTRVRKFNFGDGQTTYIATSTATPKLLYPLEPRLMVVDLATDPCGVTYEQVDLDADALGRDQSFISEVQNFGSESAKLTARRLLVMNAVTNLVFGTELHSQQGRQISWESRKAWLALEEVGQTNRYTEGQSCDGKGGFFRWHFLPELHR